MAAVKQLTAKPFTLPRRALTSSDFSQLEDVAHALRATAATNALDREADIAKIHEWLGHANIATTRIQW